ncbi:MAG: hypothetical protein JXA42_20770 [Anaerolineales bacterium]|nr:hypothetical protein [Anaerolineales bacterium]
MSNATWRQVIDRIESYHLESPQWISNKRNLLIIIEKAQEWDFDPSLFLAPPISKLREIIRVSKEAVETDNSYWLKDVMQWANTLTLAELRLRLGTTIPARIHVRQVNIGEEDNYAVTLTGNQLHQIQNTMKLMYSFIETD